MLNAPTIAARHRFAEMVHHANVDDDVKVLVVRGVGEHFGSGADLPEMARPRFEYLSTESMSFARYVAARASRKPT